MVCAISRNHGIGSESRFWKSRTVGGEEYDVEIENDSGAGN